MRETVGRYLARTRESTYSLVLVVPFLAIYEVGLLALRLGHDEFRVRNGADAIIRSLLFPLGIQSAGTAGAFAWSVVSALVLFGCWAVWRRRENLAGSEIGEGHGCYGGIAAPVCVRAAARTGRREPFRPAYVGWLFAEATLWALVLFAASASFFRAAMRTDGSGARKIATEVVLNCGAGVYEELVFRVLLVLVLAMFFTKVVHLERVAGGIAAAAGAAVIFSLVHFQGGPAGDPWAVQNFWPLFAFRAGAGLFFSLLFYFRSFGLAVATHALYDGLVTAAVAGG